MMKVLYINNEDCIIGGATLSLENLLHSVKDSVEARIVVRAEGTVSQYLRDAGFKVYVVPFQRATFNGSILKRVGRFVPHWINVMVDRLRFVGIIQKTLGEWTPDIVHSNSGTIDIGLHLAKALGIPHVWHLREFMDLDFDQHPYPSWKVWRKELSSSNAVIAVSSGIYRHHKLEQHPGARWINDAVRPASFRKLLTPKEKYFVFCASIYSEAKMPEVAVRAFRDSGVWKDGYRLRLVGNCPPELRRRLCDIAAEAAPMLEFPGFAADVSEHMLHASAFLMTSRCEGLGRVTVEAMFCGCPVIARRSGGSLDILDDGKTGFLFSSEKECARLIRQVAANTPMEVVKAAADRAVAAFSEEAYGKKILEVYGSLNCMN